MAEIPIQRKQGRTMWPWLVGLAVLLVLVWALLGRHGTNRSVAARHDTTTTMSNGRMADTAMRAPYGSTGTATPTTPR